MELEFISPQERRFLKYTLYAFFLICSFWMHITDVFSTPVINEVVALNRSTLYDEDAESSDWIEIFNPNKDSINLEGYYLTDDQSDLKKWRFPNSLLASGEYVIVFASGKDRDEGELHANFKISKAGGYLGLVDPDGETVISEISDLPPQFEDFSYGIKSNSTSFSKVLVREGDACKILVPTRDIGTTWRTLIFNDQTWSDATTGIGYERSSGYQNLIGAGGDIEDETYDKNSTAYIRIPFFVESIKELSSLV
ncbi:MAG: lamin tail domain-containing protein, partial [Verrucomicrobiota bacterium]|nr:lamin tail domain-containing protein [Verrucomicrobiota bacterium]